jgi:hypothetical protein
MITTASNPTTEQPTTHQVTSRPMTPMVPTPIPIPTLTLIPIWNTRAITMTAVTAMTATMTHQYKTKKGKKLKNDSTQHMTKAEMETKYGPCNSTHGLRPRRLRDYDHSMQDSESIALTQHIMQKGLKIFGDPGTEAVLSKLKQLHNCNVLAPKNSNELSTFDKKATLKYLMFLKQKRCGKIKARGCADGRKQRAYTAKEDASLPTVAIESVLLTWLCH